MLTTLCAPPPAPGTGRMNASVAEVMAEAGKAINDTFKQSVIELPGPVSGASFSVVLG